MKNDFVAIYVRVSTREQAEEGYSIGEQTERLKKLCEAHSWRVFRVYTDAGFSGASLDRPGLKELIEDVRAERVGKVLVYKLDRLSRSQKDTLRLIEDEFLRHGVDFESLTENLDTSTPHGRAMIGILAAFAQLEREQIKERMMMGADARARGGLWGGGNKAPLGYSYKAGDDVLQIVPEEAELIRYIFREFVSGTSINTLRKAMGKQRRQIQAILANKTYRGYVKRRDTYYKAKHEPIIDAETFEKAQEILSENKRRWNETKTCVNGDLPKTLLTGILFCSKCGAKYCKRTIHHIDYYACCSRAKKTREMVKDPDCKNRSWRVAELDALVLGEVEKLRLDPEALKKRKPKDPAPERDLIEKRVETLTRQIRRLMDLYSLETFSIEDIAEKIKPLEDERRNLRGLLKNAPKKSPEKDVGKIIETLSEALQASDLMKKRALIQQLIDKIELDGEDVTIFWNF